MSSENTKFCINSRRAIICKYPPTARETNQSKVAVLPREPPAFEAKRLAIAAATHGAEAAATGQFGSQWTSSASGISTTQFRKRRIEAGTPSLYYDRSLLVEESHTGQLIGEGDEGASSCCDPRLRLPGEPAYPESIELLSSSSTTQSACCNYKGSSASDHYGSGRNRWVYRRVLFGLLLVALCLTLFHGRRTYKLDAHKQLEEMAVRNPSRYLASIGKLLLPKMFFAHKPVQSNEDLFRVLNKANSEIDLLYQRLAKLEAGKQHQRESEQKNSRDETVTELQSQISDLSAEVGRIMAEHDKKAKRLEIEIHEAKSQLISHQKTLKDRLAPSQGELSVNFATWSMGASIMKAYSSAGIQGSRWNSRLAAAMRTLNNVAVDFIAPQYADTLRAREFRDINVVIDDVPIRGPGDCFYIPGSAANITVSLSMPVTIISVGIEHIHKKLDPAPEMAPTRVDVFVTPLSNTKIKVNQTTAEVTTPMKETYGKSPNEFVAQISVDNTNSATIFTQTLESPYSTLAQRVRFLISGVRPNDSIDPFPGLCVYRLKVYGTMNWRTA